MTSIESSSLLARARSPSARSTASSSVGAEPELGDNREHRTGRRRLVSELQRLREVASGVSHGDARRASGNAQEAVRVNRPDGRARQTGENDTAASASKRYVLVRMAAVSIAHSVRLESRPCCPHAGLLSAALVFPLDESCAVLWPQRRAQKPRGDDMSKTIQQKMHGQHRRWQNDVAAWRLDDDEWRKELRAASATLDDLRDTLRDALDAVDSHAEAVWEEEQRIHAHELSLCRESMEGQRKKTDKRWAAIHHRQTAQHERLAAAHERIKKHHHQVVAEVWRLLEQARETM